MLFSTCLLPAGYPYSYFNREVQARGAVMEFRDHKKRLDLARSTYNVIVRRLD
jgi:hypothetical protein